MTGTNPIGYLLILVCALFPALGWAEAGRSLPEEWKLTEVPGVEKAWVHFRHPGRMITLVKSRSDGRMSLKGVSQDEIMAGLTVMRKLTMEPFGFSNWRLHRFQHRRIQSFDLVEMSGRYRRPDQTTVQFFEHQYYSGQTFLQISYLVEAETEPENRSEIERLLRTLSPLKGRDREPAGLQATADACLDCLSPLESDARSTKEQIEGLKHITDQAIASEPEKVCAEKGLLIDPEKKAAIGSWGQDGKQPDLLTLAGRNYLSCLYGVGSGSLTSIRHLVEAVPDLLGLSWRTMKKASAKIGEIDLRAWLKDFSPQKALDSTGRTLTATRDTAVRAYQRSSEVVYNAYEKGGVSGSVAAVAQAAYAASPHQAIGAYLSDIGVAIAKAIGKEWDAFVCLDPAVMTEMVCTVAGYIATDVFTGKVLISAIARLPKLKEAVALAKAALERKPIIGAWLTKNLKKTDPARCGKFKDPDWKIDARAKLQNQDIDVVLDGKTVLARGIDPSTRKLGCFEVAGQMAAEIRGRISASNQRNDTWALLPNETKDFYSAYNPAYARTTEDFISGVNQRAGVKLSSSEVKKIETVLKQDPAQTERYGDLLRSIDEMRQKMNRLPEGSEERKALAKSLSQATEGMKSVNRTLSTVDSPARVNLSIWNEALDEAVTLQNSEKLVILNRALYEFNKTAKPDSTRIAESFKAWEDALLKERPLLTQDDVKKARQCLFEAPQISR